MPSWLVVEKPTFILPLTLSGIVTPFTVRGLIDGLDLTADSNQMDHLRGSSQYGYRSCDYCPKRRRNVAQWLDDSTGGCNRASVRAGRAPSPAIQFRQVRMKKAMVVGRREPASIALQAQVSGVTPTPGKERSLK